MRYICHFGKHYASGVGQGVTSFLTHLAFACHVAAATQNQVRSALLFLYREVLGVDLPWLNEVVRAKTPQRLKQQI